MRLLIEKEKMIRTVRRISHEILERNVDHEKLVLLGVLQNGMPIAEMIQENIERIEGIQVPVYPLDIRSYRDDDKKVGGIPKLDVDLSGTIAVIVDDVFYTGRTVRASMDAIIDLGRPQKIQLAVLVDRGHRELPIQADYVGKNIPTSRDELVIVSFTGDQGVYIRNKEERN